MLMPYLVIGGCVCKYFFMTVEDIFNIRKKNVLDAHMYIFTYLGMYTYVYVVHTHEWIA
jgi:hypothetical protein